MHKPRIFLNWQRNVVLSALAITVFIFTNPTTYFAQGKLSVVSIADAKKLPLGKEVTVEGSVTVASGTFRSSFSDEGFQVQDKTGGMYITIKNDPHLIVGQRVRFTGKLTETRLKFQIIETVESSVQVLSGTYLPKPIPVGTGKITEPIIGKLIKLLGVVTRAVYEIAPYGFRFSVDDGTGETIVYVSTSTGISQKDIILGQKIELIGVAGEFNQRYQIYPRSPADVKLIGKRER